MMIVKNPDYRNATEKIFSESPYVIDMGLEIKDIAPGMCETELFLQPRHLQQNGLPHAGLHAAIANQTCGGAAWTMLDGTQYLLTVEYKLNFLAKADGDSLRCRAKVLRAGNRLSNVEAEIFARKDGNESPVTKASMTFAVCNVSS